MDDDGMEMQIVIARETAWKLGLRTKCNVELKSSWCGVLDHVVILHVMPSQRSADKETLSFYVPRTLGRRLRKLAAILKATLTDVVVMVLTKETSHVELSAEDYEEIARDTRSAQRKNSSRVKAKAAAKRKG